MLPPRAQKLGEYAAQLVQGIELLEPHLVASFVLVPASGAGNAGGLSSTEEDIASALHLLRQSTAPLLALPGFRDFVQFDRLARDLAEDRAPHHALCEMLPGYL